MPPPQGACGRGCAPVPNSMWGRGLSERSEFRSPSKWDRGKGPRRATPGRPWFWVLLPKQKDRVVRGRNPASIPPLVVRGRDPARTRFSLSVIPSVVSGDPALIVEDDRRGPVRRPNSLMPSTNARTFTMPERPQPSAHETGAESRTAGESAGKNRQGGAGGHEGWSAG